MRLSKQAALLAALWLDSASGNAVDVAVDGSGEVFAADCQTTAARRLAFLNASVEEGRLLEASVGCQACCGKEADCQKAFKNDEEGMCCDHSNPLCCPTGTSCVAPSAIHPTGGCRRHAPVQPQTVTTVTHRTHYGPGGYYGHHRYGHHSPASNIIGGFAFLLFFCVFCSLIGNGLRRTQMQQPIGGQPVYGGGGGMDVGLGMGGGFLGGLALGSLLSPGPGYGYDGGGGGGGDFFAGDGGGGGDFGGGDGGGDFMGGDD
eukprot:TRINITY_DN24212_c0_g1_i2.p1 TRINITY_DN24212_c0_g1~~TRINITY_DN24212_c0_g1_i2.p1  ORF type:complete len:260 (+),score=53.38 TRINITY_DN24212_c0_g1_i2:77-856(+)